MALPQVSNLNEGPTKTWAPTIIQKLCVALGERHAQCARNEAKISINDDVPLNDDKKNVDTKIPKLNFFSYFKPL